MNIIEEFFIKYGTDAKDAARDVEALDNKIAALASKGAKRSEEEQKQLKELRKQRQSQVSDLKDITHQTDKLNLSFSNLLTAGGSAFLAIKTIGDVFTKIKEVVVDAAQYNFELSKTASLTGISARELSIWNGAVEQAGGSANEFLGFITKLNAQYASLGVNDRIKNVTRDLLTLSKAWDGLNSDQRQQRAAQLGLGPGEVLLLNQGYDKMVQILQAQALYNNQSEKSAEIGKEVYQTQVLVDKQWKAIGTDLEPIYLFWVKLKLAFADALRIVIDLGSAVLRVAQAGVQLVGGNFHGAAKTLEKAGGDIGDAFSQWWEGGKQLGGTGAYAKGAKAPTLNPTPSTGGIPPLGIRSNNPGNLQPGGREAIFGSLEEGIAAEEAQLGRYGSRGVTTLAQLAAKWPDRAGAAGWLQNVSKYSGFGPNQPLDFSDPATQAKLANAINAAENGATFGNLINTANASIAQANSIPLPGGGNSHSLSIGAVTINTPQGNAAGIARDFHGEMQKQYSQAISSTDDGVQY